MKGSIKLIDKVRMTSTRDLIKISKEIQSPSIPEDALVRQLIKDTEIDGVIYFGLIAVSSVLVTVLAERLETFLEFKEETDDESHYQ